MARRLPIGIISDVIFLLSLPALLSALVLAAHFLRAGSLVLTLLCLAFPLLLIPRRPIFTRLLQLVLILAAVEWLRTLKVIIDYRQAIGEPWQRSVYILGSVAAFNLIAALLLEGVVRSRRRRARPTAAPPA